MERSMKFRVAAVCAPMMFLAACGGGGGGDDGAPLPGPAEVQGVVITSTNAKAVSADAIGASTNTSAAADAGLPVGVQVVPAAAGTGGTLRLGSIARTLAAKAGALQDVVAGVAVNETLPCSGGGNIVVSGNVNGSDWLMAGDTVTTTARNCTETVDGVATTMNGQLTLKVLSGSFYSAAMAPFNVTMRVDVSNMSITTGGVTETMDGDMTLAYASSTANVETIVISGTSLATSSNAGGTQVSVKMKNYRQDIGTDHGATTMTVSMGVESRHPRLGNSTVAYEVSTLAAWKTDASGNVTAGSLKVVGQASQATITVTGTNTFEIAVDANADGSYEQTQSATLEELRGLH